MPTIVDLSLGSQTRTGRQTGQPGGQRTREIRVNPASLSGQECPILGEEEEPPAGASELAHCGDGGVISVCEVSADPRWKLEKPSNNDSTSRSARRATNEVSHAANALPPARRQ